MTDRHAGYIVVLQDDLREDDAEATITALRQIKGVLNVQPIVSEPDVHIGYIRAKHDITMRVYKALSDKD